MQGIKDSDYEVCPYDRSHHILRTRFQVHLGRCRRNHKGIPKVTCPFNVTHVLNKPEFEWHVSNCPERKSFENFKYRLEAVISPTPEPPHPICESSENWDNDPDVPSYNPHKYTENALVIRNLQGASKAVKKQFREQERLRFLELNK